LRDFAISKGLLFADESKVTRLVYGTLLDIVITNRADLLLYHSVYPCPFSGYSIVVAELCLKTSTQTYVPKELWGLGLGEQLRPNLSPENF
jgi:hypothetical protein